MNLVKNAALASTVALLMIGTTGIANADDKDWRHNRCADTQECSSPRVQLPYQDEQGEFDKRRFKLEQNDSEQQADDQPIRRRRHLQDELSSDGQVAEQPSFKRREAENQADWKFDYKKHKRRHKKDDHFRFSFGGWWYPEPYWYGHGFYRPYRISCFEGREALLDRGFYRIRTIECSGKAYTYFGKRRGGTFEVLVSSRSGRILSVRPI
jgi:hypothetical protein